MSNLAQAVASVYHFTMTSSLACQSIFLYFHESTCCQLKLALLNVMCVLSTVTPCPLLSALCHLVTWEGLQAYLDITRHVVHTSTPVASCTIVQNFIKISIQILCKLTTLQMFCNVKQLLNLYEIKKVTLHSTCKQWFKEPRLILKVCFTSWFCHCIEPNWLQHWLRMKWCFRVKYTSSLYLSSTAGSCWNISSTLKF